MSRATRESAEDLLRLVLAAIVERRSPDETRWADAGASADAAAWSSWVQLLSEHRLVAGAWATLKECAAGEILPPDVRSALSRSYQRVRRLNELAFARLDAVLERLYVRGIAPVLLKGAALVHLVYDDPGARTMRDVDLLVKEDEREATESELVELGFSVAQRSRDATLFADAAGGVFDVHHRFRLFESESAERLYEVAVADRLATRRVRVFEPNALLVHLLVHASSHADTTGPILGWFVDLALLVEARREDIDLERVSALSETAAEDLQRLADFLARESAWAPRGLDLGREFEGRPWTLDRILRDRRLALWELPRPRGWMRLAGRCLGLPRDRQLALPELGDLRRLFSRTKGR